jgi:hypothetical protein
VHHCLELVRHPTRRAWVQLGGCVDETARAAAPINEALDEAGRKQRDGGNAPVTLRLGHGERFRPRSLQFVAKWYAMTIPKSTPLAKLRRSAWRGCAHLPRGDECCTPSKMTHSSKRSAHAAGLNETRPSLAPFLNNQSLSENIPIGTFDWKRASSATRSTADQNSIDEEQNLGCHSIRRGCRRSAPDRQFV